MAVPELHFFAPDELNGSTILEIPVTEEGFESLVVRPALREVGSMQFRLNREWLLDLVSSGAFQPDVFVRLLHPAVSATDYYWGSFITDRIAKIIARIRAGENFSIGGLGPGWYLNRAILWNEQFSQDADRPYRIDLENKLFRFEGDADVGNVLNRLQREDNNNTIAEFLPDYTDTFDHTVDSNGDPWTEAVGTDAEPFTLPIGDSFYADLYDHLMTAVTALEVTWDLGSVGAPKMEMSAWQSYGRDLVPSGITDFSSGVVHFKEGVNIEGELDRQGRSVRNATHALVSGANGHYGRAVAAAYVPGGYARAVGIDRSDMSWVPALERAAARYLAHQAAGQNEYRVAHLPGFDPTAGLYYPGPDGSSGHYWLGDSVGVTTGGDAVGTYGPLDLRASSERVMAITLEARSVMKDGSQTERALSWNALAELNIERHSATAPSEGQAAPGGSSGGGCPCIRWCTPTIPPEIACPDVASPYDESVFWDHNDSTASSTTASSLETPSGCTYEWAYDAPITADRFTLKQALDATYGGAPDQKHATKGWVLQNWDGVSGHPWVDIYTRPNTTWQKEESVTFEPSTSMHWRVVPTEAAWHDFPPPHDAANSWIIHTLELCGPVPGTGVEGCDTAEFLGDLTCVVGCGHQHHASDIIFADGTNLEGADLGGTSSDIYLTNTQGAKERLSVIDDSGSAQVLNLADANAFDLTLTDDCDVSVTGATAGRHCWITIYARQDGDGGHCLNLDDAFHLANGDTALAIDQAADHVSIIRAFTVNGGIDWYAGVFGAAPNVAAEDVSVDTTGFDNSAATDMQQLAADFDSAISTAGATNLNALTDVAITSPAADEQLQYIGGTWVNNARRWEPVTFDPGTGPEIVFDTTDVVMTWKDY